MVSEFIQTSSTLTGQKIERRKAFLYRDAIYDVKLKEFKGFKVTGRTNWFGDGVSELWSFTRYRKFDGLIVQQWTQASNTDFSFRKTLSYTFYVYREKPGDLFVDDVILTRIRHTDNLNNTESITNYEYDSYSNPIEIKVDKRFIGGKASFQSTTTNVYNNSTTNNSAYRIGELTSTQTLRERWEGSKKESFTSKKSFTYTKQFQQESVTLENNEGKTIREDFSYDKFGNLVRREFPLVGTHRGFESYLYEQDGIRMKESSNHLNAIMTYTYTPKTFRMRTETDQFGNFTRYSYDTWGRRILSEFTSADKKEKNSTHVEYKRLNSHGLKITTYSDTGEHSEVFLNALSWPERNTVKSLNGEVQTIFTQYDVAGREISKSEPTTSGAPTLFTTTGYDEYGRKVNIVLPTGRKIVTTFDKNTVTVDDEQQQRMSVVDAQGLVISKTDAGGTLEYKYFANGEPSEIRYGDNHITTFEIDGWGRKKVTNDPSAGTYVYTYDTIGNLLKETTPNGTTTLSYDELGLLTNKSIVGKNTNMQISYQRDSYHRETGLTGVDRINSITHKITTNYDDNNRIEQQNERVAGPRVSHTFRRNLSYEDGRLATERYYSEYNGIGHRSDKTIRYHYDPESGMMDKITDTRDQKELWKLDKVTARNQLESATLGNGVVQSRIYDAYGNVERIHDYLGTEKDSPAINRFDYKYNAKRGLMTFRHNQTNPGEHQIINEENFDYDALDRLTDVSGAESVVQVYDERGNITSNNYVGDYKYDPTKLYRLSGIELNREGEYRYGKEPRETITYNAYKKPVEIRYEREGGANRITTLEYGPLMNRTQMYYDTDAEIEDKDKRRFYKMYSSIIPAEIIFDRTTKATKMITYLAGDAYSASMAHIKQQGGTAAKVDAMFYLHRDHLGSITSISNEDAKLVQHNYFGAWGDLIYQFNPTEDGLFADGSNFVLGRGFTGHEHLAGTRLIHMNGRVYDIDLRRFLAPDNFVIDSGNTQSYNRYSYVWNNPLGGTDLSGEVPFFLVPIIGGAISVLTNGISNSVEGEAFFKGADEAFLNGAFQAMASFGIGNITSGVISSLSTSVGKVGSIIVGRIIQASLHGLVAGAFNLIQGGDFKSGFVSGSVSSIASSALQGFSQIAGLGPVAQAAATIAGGGIAGGIGSELAGGTFIDGLRNGLITAGLNHAVHAIDTSIQAQDDYNPYERYFADGVERLEGYLGHAGTLGDGAEIAATTALMHRQSLSISQRVGMSRNLRFIRYASNVSRFAGHLGNIGAGLSFITTTYAVGQGHISQTEYFTNLALIGTPIALGFAYGGPAGAGAGLLFTGAELLYRGAQQFWNTIVRNTPTINFSAAGIARGFGSF